MFKPDGNAYALFAVFLIMELFLIFRVEEKLLKAIPIYRKLEPILAGILVIFTIHFKGAGHGFIYFQF